MAPQLLIVLEHSRSVLTAARALLIGISERAYEPLSDWSSSMPAHVVSFVESALSCLHRQAIERSIRVSSRALTSLFDAVLATQREEVERLVLPLARLLCDPAVIENFSVPVYQQRLTASVCWLCQELPNVSAAIFKMRMQTLALFASDESICSNICKLHGFSMFVISHLSDPESSIIPVNWRFFTQYAAHPRVLHEIIVSPAGARLAAIAGSESTPILKRFFEFSTGIWRRLDQDDVGKFCTLMMPVLGKVTCAVRTRKALFRDDARMVEVIEEYARAIMDLDAPGAERFIEAFAKHMEADLGSLLKPQGLLMLSRKAFARRPSRLLEKDLLG
jgi:hypothetical protein